MEKLVIGLIAVVLLVSISCSQAYEPVPESAPTPTPTPITTPSFAPTPTIIFPRDWTEIQISLTPGEVYRLNIFAEDNDAIEGSWKAKEDDAIYVWYTTPSGIPMLPGIVKWGMLVGGETQITPPHSTSSGLILHEAYHRFPTFPAVWGYTFEIRITGKYRGTGYYTFSFMPLSDDKGSVPVIFRYRVNETPSTLPQYPAPEPATPTTTPEPATISSAHITSSDITSEPSTYDGKEVEMLGQTYLSGSPPKLLIDGKNGINLAGNIATLKKGFYRLKGLYDSDTNTLNVTQFDERQAEYLAIEAGKGLDIDLKQVSVIGLIATTPKEVASMLTSYISIPHFPKDMPIYPYVVYTKGGFYLALSDTPVHLPSEFTFLYEGKDYSFTFSAGEVKGILVKTPLKEINFGPKWEDEFGGVIIANSISSFAPLNTTVEQINAEPDKYAFQRVSVTASYLVTTATLDYSDIKAPMGQGVLAETFTDFFGENSKKRLETIDPERKVWQLRECQMIGTVIYPTEEILKYLDYSAPLSKSEVIERLKPVLIVDTLVDDEVEIVNISELNPTVGDPSRYWGKVVQFEGYALGINYPLKTLVKTVTARDVPLNVNLLAVGIADSWLIGSQIAIIGLNNDLIGEQGEIIKGKYKFRVAVAHMPEELVSGVPGADTAFFLLSKEELPVEMPTPELYSLNVSISPPEAGLVVPPGGDSQPGTLVTLTATPALGYAFDHWSGDASGTSATITITVDSDKSITAHFKELPVEIPIYKLNVFTIPLGGGLIIPQGGVFNLASGTSVMLRAVPAPGYAFDHWSGDASGTSASIIITMDAAKNITAHFRRIL